MVFQNYVGLTRHPRQITVRSLNGRRYTATLKEGVEIPEPILSGNAIFIQCNVEFSSESPIITGFTFDERPSAKEVADLDSMVGEY